jgi:hypothetical protein
MYINGKEREAKARFKLLSAQGYSRRNTPSAEWMWRVDGEAVACAGKVCRVNRNSGFVERHGAGEWIFVPPLENGTNPLLEWDIGTRVRFNIGFDWRGPIALNVEIDSA